MADELVIQGKIGAKQQFTAVALPVGTEVVATVLGTDDAMIVLKPGLTPRQGSAIINNLLKQLAERFNEVNYDVAAI